MIKINLGYLVKFSSKGQNYLTQVCESLVLVFYNQIFVTLQTQPVPNPISYYMHQSPDWFHQVETMTNHLVELVAPILLLVPRRLCIIGGFIQIAFQVPCFFYLTEVFSSWKM